ncbi:hypothetical protein B0H66DRAFT_313472 [Apodospora peruviana]|uniref:Thioredoxin domain-containing protein n=1 Tax=Apodospora peruviana TaxID=516989 RepID=A0AAE0HX27_9PEZI|nr:hypothetical protein B0H66DRAFT_313472 [Apodospora peruviana]
MKRSISLFSFLLLGVARLGLAWNHVSEQSLQEGLDSHAYMFIAFVLPTQEESKALEKEWTVMQEKEKDDNIVSFDCSGPHLKFCKDLDVTSFPSIRLYHRDGRMDRYRGDRKGRSMGMFLHRTLAPQPLEIGVDETKVGSLSLLDDVVIIAHPHPDDWDFWDRFKALAKHYRDRYSFILSISDSGKKKSEMVCFNNIDDLKHTASEVATVEALEEFVKVCAEPLIPELTRRNEGDYTQSQKSILHYFAKTEEEKEQYREEMRPLAKKYGEFLHFTITDVNEYPTMPAMLGLRAGSKSGMVLENTNTGEKFHYKKSMQKLKADNVEKFLDDVIDGKVKAWDDGRRTHEEL